MHNTVAFNDHNNNVFVLHAASYASVIQEKSQPTGTEQLIILGKEMYRLATNEAERYNQVLQHHPQGSRLGVLFCPAHNTFPCYSPHPLFPLPHRPHRSTLIHSLGVRSELA